MNICKSVYGRRMLDLQDLIETNINHLIELTYYKIKDRNQYFVEIVKTEHINNSENDNKTDLKIESNKMNLLTNNESKTNKILDILIRNKVTPVGLEDTIEEIIKQKMI